MKKLLLIAFSCLFVAGSYGQVAEITANPGTSITPALGTSTNVASESIYTETELGGAAAFTTSATSIDRVALSVATVGSNTTFTNVKIYLKDVSLATTTFTSGTYTTAGYTLVYSGPVTLSAIGFTDIVLTTPYVRATGTNLQMLIERTEATTHVSYVYNTANGNHTSAVINTTRRYNGATALSAATLLAVSPFRQAVRLRHTHNNDARTVIIHTLGKAPLPNGAPMTIRANVVNDGLNPLTNVNVTLNVTGANTFTNTQIISSLTPGANGYVTFADFTPTVEGTNTVTVTVGADDYNANNAISMTQVINKNTWSYAYGTASSGGVGFTGATGDFVAKFNTSAATALSQVTVNFATGGQPYQIGIWDATGAGGTPGTNLYTSPTLTSAAGSNVIPVNPLVAIAAGSFYVGVRQTGTNNVSFAYQIETPIRSGTFYYASPTGATTWNDFAPANSFRFMIEPKLILPVDASISALTAPANISCYSAPQAHTAVLTNTGSTTISPNTAAVTLRVRGANTFTGTVNNTTSIPSGGTEVISFNVNISNPGTNLDTVFVNLPGDQESGNDTARTSSTTAASVSSFPFTEKFESSPLIFNYVSVLAGARTITSLQTGPYGNLDMAADLEPHSGNQMILFDNYTSPSSAGVINRLYSGCFNVPVNSAGQCGNYQLSFWMSHEDSYPTELDSLYVTISANGGNTWTRVTPGYGRYDAAFQFPGWRKEVIDLNAYAGQTIQIGFENVSKYGNVIALDDIEVSSAAAGGLALSTAANNGIALQKSCDDQGWTYYTDPSNVNQPLFAIQWDPATNGANVAAKATATPRIQLDANYYAAEDVFEQKATYTMRRYWDVDLGAATLTAPVNVRFFYDSTEKKAIITAAQNFRDANGGFVEPATWFKTVTAPFVPNSTNVTPDQITQQSIALTDVNTGNNSINGVPYAQFNGVSSFSGGTFATGVGAGFVLPIRIEYFRGAKQGTDHLLDWKISTINTQYATVTLEISEDGTSFRNIYSTRENAARFTQPFRYINNQPLNGNNYYRLKIKDDNGAVSYSNVVVLINASKGIVFVNVTPNPVAADGRIKLNMASAEKAKMDIIITDMTGRVMVKKSAAINAGTNTIDLDVSNLATGVYQVFGSTADGKTKVLQFVK